MTAEKKKAYRDIMIRTGKTFMQAFIGYFSGDIIIGITDLNVAKKMLLAMFIGALSAGICAVWNSFLEWLTIRIGEIDFDDADLESKNTVEVIADDN